MRLRLIMAVSVVCGVLGLLPTQAPAKAPMYAVASFYAAAGGPLACGGVASSWELIIANKSLPCGAVVRLCFPPRGRHKRCARTVVRDRGPYVAGRTFDLSMAVVSALGFPVSAGVATVGYTVLRL